MYGLSEQDLAIQARARAFADELIPFEEQAEASGGDLPADVTAGHAKRARELGLHSTNMPAGLGGGGCTTLQQVLAQEQMGRVTNALGWVAATPPSWLPEVATADQIDRFVRPAIAGEREECWSLLRRRLPSVQDRVAARLRLSRIVDTCRRHRGVAPIHDHRRHILSCGWRNCGRRSHDRGPLRLPWQRYRSTMMRATTTEPSPL